MTTTVKAIYRAGVLRLRRRLPLPADTEVAVTLELPAEATGKAGLVPGDGPVVWPDVALRLRRIYGDKLVPENPILAAREEEIH